MTITFESISHEGGTHSIKMAMNGEETVVAISVNEWETLQRAAKMLVFYVHPANHDENAERRKASEDAVRDAYLAFALSHPQYRRTETAEKQGIHAPDGMSFHTEIFTSGQRDNFFHPIMQMCMTTLAKPKKPDDAPLSVPVLLREMKRVTTPKPVVTQVQPAIMVSATQHNGRS